MQAMFMHFLGLGSRCVAARWGERWRAWKHATCSRPTPATASTSTTTHKDLDVVRIGSRSALGTVTWELLREDESVLKTWRESYNLVLSSGGLKIFASTDHVE